MISHFLNTMEIALGILIETHVYIVFVLAWIITETMFLLFFFSVLLPLAVTFTPLKSWDSDILSFPFQYFTMVYLFYLPSFSNIYRLQHSCPNTPAQPVTYGYVQPQVSKVTMNVAPQKIIKLLKTFWALFFFCKPVCSSQEWAFQMKTLY